MAAVDDPQSIAAVQVLFAPVDGVGGGGFVDGHNVALGVADVVGIVFLDAVLLCVVAELGVGPTLVSHLLHFAIGIPGDGRTSLDVTNEVTGAIIGVSQANF